MRHNSSVTTNAFTTALADSPAVRRADATTMADRIRASAREDIRQHGILGLRVTRVAERAYCSVTQIYRHFEDRDGLLADVLAELYAEMSEQTITAAIANLSAMPVISVRDVIDLLPMPSGVTHREESLLRSQILAVATVNSELRDRLAEIAQATYPRWGAACDLVESRLVPGETFDRRAVFVLLLNSNLFYNSLLDDMAITDDEYRQFLFDAFTMRRN